MSCAITGISSPGPPGGQQVRGSVSSSTLAAACPPRRTRTPARRRSCHEPHVAYVDNDAVVLAHLRALAAKGNPGVTVVDGDVRDVATTLDAVSAGIDLSMPACLLMGALLHFFPPDAARDLVAGYVTALTPGSYVVLSVGRGDGDGRSRASPPPSGAQHGPTTTRWPTSRASSATSPSSRRASPTPGSGIPTPARRGRSRRAAATRSPASPASAAAATAAASTGRQDRPRPTE